MLSQVRKKPLDVANDSVRKGEDQPGFCVVTGEKETTGYSKR